MILIPTPRPDPSNNHRHARHPAHAAPSTQSSLRPEAENRQWRLPIWKVVPHECGIVNHELSYQVVFLANAGIHSFQYIDLHGCPIKEFGQKVNVTEGNARGAACGREATLGYDGHSKHDSL